MGTYVYTLKGKVKNLILTKEASKSLGDKVMKAIAAEFYSHWNDKYPWSDEEQTTCKRLNISSLNPLNHGRGKALMTRLENKNLNDVEFVFFGDYGGKYGLEFRNGNVAFLDTPYYTYNGQIGFMKKFKGKHYACPYYCLFKSNGKWIKGLVEDLQIEKGEAISYTIKTGTFYQDSPMLNDVKFVSVKPQDVDFHYGFLSYRDKEWMISVEEINQMILNKKLNKIKI